MAKEAIHFRWQTMICWVIGHRFKYKMTSLEGDKYYRCERCRAMKTGKWLTGDFCDH